MGRRGAQLDPSTHLLAPPRLTCLGHISGTFHALRYVQPAGAKLDRLHICRSFETDGASALGGGVAPLRSVYACRGECTVREKPAGLGEPCPHMRRLWPCHLANPSGVDCIDPTEKLKLNQEADVAQQRTDQQVPIHSCPVPHSVYYHPYHHPFYLS